MPLVYSDATKTDRLRATRARVAGGTLEIGTAGMKQVLARFKLSESGGEIHDDVWSLGLSNDSTLGLPAAGKGAKAVAAHLRSRSGAIEISGLTVGTADADIIADQQTIADNQDVVIGSITFVHA